MEITCTCSLRGEPPGSQKRDIHLRHRGAELLTNVTPPTIRHAFTPVDVMITKPRSALLRSAIISIQFNSLLIYSSINYERKSQPGIQDEIGEDKTGVNQSKKRQK